MSALHRRFGSLLLLALASAGCELENFGYADPGSCGMGSCPEPYIPYRPAVAYVTLRFDVTGLTSEHAADSYQFVSRSDAGEVIGTQLVPVTTQQLGVVISAASSEFSYLGLVDE